MGSLFWPRGIQREAGPSHGEGTRRVQAHDLLLQTGPHKVLALKFTD